MLDEAAVLALFESCSNAGRWGADDERGTLNLITADKRRAALATVSSGFVVSLGHELILHGGRQWPPSASLVMACLGPGEISAQDLLTLNPHGFEMTHLDAVAHVVHKGRLYNGRLMRDVFTTRGLAFGSVTAAGDGIVTRGVLLDVAASRGQDHLEPGDGVTAADLEAAERMAGVTVEPGDAVFVRVGLARRLRDGELDAGEPREGLLADAVAWLHERDVAVYAGDCIERLPSGYSEVPMPLHQIGQVAMGLWLLDNPDLEALREACETQGRHVFLLVVAPLRVPGGTASPVNPLAIF